MFFLKALVVVSIIVPPLIIQTESQLIKCYMCYTGLHANCLSANELRQESYCESREMCVVGVKKDGKNEIARTCKERIVGGFEASLGCTQFRDSEDGNWVNVCGCDTNWCNNNSVSEIGGKTGPREIIVTWILPSIAIVSLIVIFVVVYEEKC